MTHTVNGKLSGIIQPDTERNREWVLDFWKRYDAHYGTTHSVIFITD